MQGHYTNSLFNGQFGRPGLLRGSWFSRVCWIQAFIVEVVFRYIDDRWDVNVMQALMVPNADNMQLVDIVKEFKRRLNVVGRVPLLQKREGVDIMRSALAASLPQRARVRAGDL